MWLGIILGSGCIKGKVVQVKKLLALVMTSVLATLLVVVGTSCAGTPVANGGIEGTVTDPDGNPVAGMRVWIVSGTTAFPEMAPETNDEGYYRIGSVPPGTFKVAVHDREGDRIGLDSVVVRSGETSTLNLTIATGEITEEQFKTLLTVEDIESILPFMVAWKTEFFDNKQMAESVDPAQVANLDSWYGMGFDTEDGMKGLTFSVIDFGSQTSAQDHFEKVRAETPGLEIMSLPIGDASAEVEVNAQGIGSIIVFITGDKLIQLHTAMPAGGGALVDLEELEELVRIVESRL
jgi:hypothetical protein